jgi:hypothetical protein
LPGATAAVGAGAVLTPPLPADIDGERRDTAPDVGADEYVVPAATYALIASVSISVRGPSE